MQSLASALTNYPPTCTSQTEVSTRTGGGSGAQPLPVCPRCHGAGWIVPGRDAGDHSLVECPACDTVQQRRMAAVQVMTDLAGDLLTRTFANFRARDAETTAMLKSALAFADRPRDWLLLSGKNGTGKTHLAAAIANQMRTRNRVCLFLTAPALLAYLRSAFDPRRERDNEWMTLDQRVQYIRDVPVLVLDDLGAEKATDWTNEQLFILLNDRQVKRMPTVITTNLRPQDFEPRMASRLGNRDVVTIAGSFGAGDYRRRGEGNV